MPDRLLLRTGYCRGPPLCMHHFDLRPARYAIVACMHAMGNMPIKSKNPSLSLFSGFSLLRLCLPYPTRSPFSLSVVCFVVFCFWCPSFSLLTYVHVQSYLESRSTAVQEVEGHIAELGLIFNKLATMLQDQREMVER